MFGEVEKNWVWLLAVGVFFIALGIGSLLLLPLVTALTAVVFGAFAIAAGIFHLFDAIAHEKGWISRVASGFLALLYILFGVLTFYNPMLGAAAITFAMAVIFVIIGLLRAYISIKNRIHFPHWHLGVVSGALTMVLGALLLIGFPQTSVWFLGLFVAIDFILNGIVLVYLALAAREGLVVG